jgi:hypothetical protein
MHKRDYLCLAVLRNWVPIRRILRESGREREKYCHLSRGARNQSDCAGEGQQQIIIPDQNRSFHIATRLKSEPPRLLLRRLEKAHCCTLNRDITRTILVWSGYFTSMLVFVSSVFLAFGPAGTMTIFFCLAA